MAKPRKKYRPKPIMSWLTPEQRKPIEIIGHFFAPKLAAGIFDDIEGNTLAFTINVARRMAIELDHQVMIDMTDAAMHAYLGIRTRKQRIGKWGANGEELLVLEKHLPDITAWYIKQPVYRIQAARDWVYRNNVKMQQAGVLFADISDNGELENVVRAA